MLPVQPEFLLDQCEIGYTVCPMSLKSDMGYVGIDILCLVSKLVIESRIMGGTYPLNIWTDTTPGESFSGMCK